MRRRFTKYVAAGVVVGGFIVLGVSGCGTDKATERFKDAERGDTNTAPADTMTFPDGFSNVAAKCDGSTRVYVIFKGDDATRGSIAVSPNHPKCEGSQR